MIDTRALKVLTLSSVGPFTSSMGWPQQARQSVSSSDHARRERTIRSSSTVHVLLPCIEHRRSGHRLRLRSYANLIGLPGISSTATVCQATENGPYIERYLPVPVVDLANWRQCTVVKRPNCPGCPCRLWEAADLMITCTVSPQSTVFPLQENQPLKRQLSAART